MRRGEYPPAAREGGCPPSAEGGKAFPLMKHREEETEPLRRLRAAPPLSGEAFGRGQAAVGKAPLKGELARQGLRGYVGA